MSKRAEDLAKQLYPDPKLENYDDILVYRADRDNASMGRINVVRVYEQAEKDLALTWEDMKAITDIADKMMEEIVPHHSPEWLETEEKYYTEVLKRYLETKK